MLLASSICCSLCIPEMYVYIFNYNLFISFVIHNFLISSMNVVEVSIITILIIYCIISLSQLVQLFLNGLYIPYLVSSSVPIV